MAGTWLWWKTTSITMHWSVTTHDTSAHKTTLLQLQIDDQGGVAQTSLYSYSSYDKYGEGEIQISPDGGSLAIYNHKKAFGFFNHRTIELITLKLDASYIKPLTRLFQKYTLILMAIIQKEVWSSAVQESICTLSR